LTQNLAEQRERALSFLCFESSRAVPPIPRWSACYNFAGFRNEARLNSYSGTTAVASISTTAPGSIRAETSTADIAG